MNEEQQQLLNEKEKIEAEINQLLQLREGINTEAIDIIINSIKVDLHKNIEEEDWKGLKLNKAKIEKLRYLENILSNQEELITDKYKDLELIEYKIHNRQLSLTESEESTFSS